jgi:hypothetical protein
MKRIHKLIGIALFAAMIAGTARAAETPDTTMDARAPDVFSLASSANTKAADTSKRSCVDINDQSFEWRWSNVPFASTCDAAPERKQVRE